MAWNQSTGAAVKPTPKKPSALRGVIAGAVVVAAAVAIFFAMSGKDEKPKAKAEKNAGLIREVKPKVPSDASAPKKSEPKLPWLYASTTNGLTELQRAKWRAFHRPKPGFTNRVAGTETKARYEIFKHHSENTIACYLAIEPGASLVGTPHYGPSFKRDFLKSLEEPIVIDPNDSEYDKELKAAVREMKVELKLRMDAGEDIGQILLATRQELQALGRYKADLSGQLNQVLKDESLTEKDVEDFVTAANQMLEQKGIAPIKMSHVTKKMFLMNQGRKSRARIQALKKTK